MQLSLMDQPPRDDLSDLDPAGLVRPTPPRSTAPLCRCPRPIVDEGDCAKCGRRVA